MSKGEDNFDNFVEAEENTRTNTESKATPSETEGLTASDRIYSSDSKELNDELNARVPIQLKSGKFDRYKLLLLRALRSDEYESFDSNIKDSIMLSPSKPISPELIPFVETIIEQEIKKGGLSSFPGVTSVENMKKISEEAQLFTSETFELRKLVTYKGQKWDRFKFIVNSSPEALADRPDIKESIEKFPDKPFLLEHLSIVTPIIERYNEINGKNSQVGNIKVDTSIETMKRTSLEAYGAGRIDVKEFNPADPVEKSAQIQAALTTKPILKKDTNIPLGKQKTGESKKVRFI